MSEAAGERLDPDAAPAYSAALYAQARPRYPEALFDFLLSLVERHDLAWDCATGTGQAALSLAERFARVVATDISADQIAHAEPHPRIEYRVAPADDSGLPDHSADIVTVASAVHWFDLDRFYAEVRRVIRPTGVLAVWTYHAFYLEPPLDAVFLRLYRDVLAPYFPQGATFVDERYETLPVPGAPIDAPPFSVTADWTFDQLLAFIASLSGTQKYRAERAADPLDHVRPELEAAWGDTSASRTVRWPLFLRAVRL